MLIQYYRKSNYGIDMMYVRDTEIATRLMLLTGKLTIDAEDIENLSALGHTFEEVIAPRPVKA